MYVVIEWVVLVMAVFSVNFLPSVAVAKAEVPSVVSRSQSVCFFIRIFTYDYGFLHQMFTLVFALTCICKLFLLMGPFSFQR